jgi:hypothetical protein
MPILKRRTSVREGGAMTFLHWKIPGSTGDLVRIQMNGPAYVRLLDPLNFEYYKKGMKYDGQGGWSDRRDAEFVLPYKGTFHVVIDLGKEQGELKATCDITRNSSS